MWDIPKSIAFVLFVRIWQDYDTNKKVLINYQENKCVIKATVPLETKQKAHAFPHEREWCIILNVD